MLSHRDMDGVLWCDCTECAMGWNGDKSCGEGWAESKPGCMGCTRGRLLEGLKDQLSRKGQQK